MLTVDISNAKRFLPQQDLTDALAAACAKLDRGDGLGGEFTGWVHLPRDYDKEEFSRIQAAAARIQSDSKALVVIGIGGSYLGARAVIELLKSPNYNLLPKSTPDIYFVGNGLSYGTSVLSISRNRQVILFFSSSSNGISYTVSNI